ncbi:MAG: hypothetical protein IPJ27_18025 [Candidatus Accumulibacter sp.]|uniref:Lipoprotein n=1 Tax=Candidatus Accumulibacter proximus TaxID=2954385 RepID=A0A935Q2E5_9PROT|nr:hypothetical protein [Candidatus Accumulibacter proximus]
MKRTTLVSLIIATTLSACAGLSAELTQREVAKERLAKAEAMFQERCKKSGEFIHRTAENVEGVFLLKLRPKKINHGDQFKMDDPYGRDVGGDGYITNFLLGRDAKGSLVEQSAFKNGYIYVDAIDPEDGKRYRYTGGMKVVGRKDVSAKGVQMALERNPSFDLNIYAFRLDRVPAPDPAPRYGVTYDDISTLEERDYWIAGSSLKVIDLATNEVMAERIGYMMDRGQGKKSGGRSPWLFAAHHACPSFPTTPGGQPFKMDQTRDFVEKTLPIKQEK